jgi:hypothetical protein
VRPRVLGDHDQVAAGAEHLVTGGVDLGHRGLVGGAAGVADVGPVPRVVERLGRAHPLAPDPRPLVDDPGVAPVRRGGDDQVDVAGEVAEQLGQRSGVAVADLGPGPAGAGEHVVEVLGGEGDPAGVELDADRSAVEEGGFGEGGADAGQRVDDELAGLGVLDDDAPGKLGQHLARMGRAAGQVAAGSLPLGGGLGHRPDGEGDLGAGPVGGPGGGGCGHGLCPRPKQASPKEQGVRAPFPTKSLPVEPGLAPFPGVREPSSLALRSRTRRGRSSKNRTPRPGRNHHGTTAADH